jgi:hypothetical protein
MAIKVNDTGILPEGDYKIFALMRISVSDKTSLFDYAYLGPKMCVYGENLEDARQETHKIVDMLFDGFKEKLEKTNE